MMGLRYDRGVAIPGLGHRELLALIIESRFKALHVLLRDSRTWVGRMEGRGVFECYIETFGPRSSSSLLSSSHSAANARTR